MPVKKAATTRGARPGTPTAVAPCRKDGTQGLLLALPAWAQRVLWAREQASKPT